VRFLVRRGLKIYPAYFVFIAYLVLMPLLKVALSGGDLWAVVQKQWGLYWPNLVFLQNYVGPNPAGHTWSLAVEEHFYLILPVLLAWLAATGRMRMLFMICFACAAVCLSLRGLSVWTEDPFSVQMAATHLRLDALMCGVAIRGLAQYRPENFAASRSFRSLLVATGVALWSLNLFIEPQTAFIRTIGLSATYLGAAAFLVAAYNTHAGDFGRWRGAVAMVSGAIAWIGVYSYGIYLWHVTAMGILEREFAGRWMGEATALTAGGWLLCALVVCGGAIVVGALTSKAIEWPVLRLRDRLFPSRLEAGVRRPRGQALQVATAAALAVRRAFRLFRHRSS
jgi:peptidoglycan/LPS O-acetylase OafA/YrhL